MGINTNQRNHAEAYGEDFSRYYLATRDYLCYNNLKYTSQRRIQNARLR